MTDSLAANLGSIFDEKDESESFIQQYLELPNSKALTELRERKEYFISDDKKVDKLLSALSNFDRKLEKRVTNITSKLSDVHQELLEVRQLSHHNLTPASSPEPEAPEGGGIEKKNHSMIRRESTANAAKMLPPNAVRRNLSMKPNNLASWPSTVTGTTYPRRSEAHWSSEKSVHVETTDRSSNGERLNQLHDQLTVLDYRASTKLEDLKGPKHQARLKAVRGYCIDERILPLPTNLRKVEKRPDPAEPNCYQINRCLQARYPKAIALRKENYLYSSLEFVD
ncbi:uncharacterized protein [Watersipora subatra]|uniref:uncharacterized protein n=1 Tax=Watersipora subatra TaxID=2589382 RepID=UPI00355B3F3F